MVPCQPRQLVIFSLPFAALVAFFWFKRRRSLSRSDPGGTLDHTKPVDNSAKSSVPEGSSSTVVADRNIEVTCSKSSVLEEFTVKDIPTVTCLPSKAEKVNESVITPLKEVEDGIIKSGIRSAWNSVDTPTGKAVEKHLTKNNKLVKSIPEAETEKLVCNGVALHFETAPEVESKKIETNLSSPDFNLSGVFHSSVIEEEYLSSAVEEVVLPSEVKELGTSKKNQLDNSKEDKIDSKNISVTESNISGEKEDLDTTLVDIRLEEETSDIPIEEQSTKENSALQQTLYTEEREEKLEAADKSSEIAVTVGKNNLSKTEACDSDSVERIEDVSADTGLGSQDLSATEDSTETEMAQGHSTEETESSTTGLEQKLASLGLDTQQAAAAQRAERDSANHSPAEVMLNSPAISTFSDAHSEGSSDSGKGCSDVVTPPSRTPAGGSSVAGDQVASIYEFVLPQVIVGRLIGRHGVFLHDIRAKTHTNVFIKRHPETNSLKICAIEGTQPDIDAALKMIRQKFPLRRFPDLTLERVSFVKSTCLPINPENLQLHLVEGVNNDVLVAYVVSAGHMFLQLPMHMSYHSLYRMACIMNTVYNTEESPPLPDPQPDVVCVAPAAGGWYRAQILSVDEEANTSDVRFLDYGGFLTIDNSLLRQIRGDFMLLPFQAVECVLANVVPAGGKEEWSEEATQFVQSVTTQQILQAQVYEFTDTGIPMVYLYFTQFYQSSTDPSGLESRVVLLNQELVSHGYAELIEDVTQEEGQTATTDTS